jgi:excisionase family DNA binding protein
MKDGPQTAASIRWITSGEIKNVEGAHKPGAYVARAYAFQKSHQGTHPPWAKKSPNGNWCFDEAYIARCAHDNIDYIGISEAARLLGVTRRTVQTWADENIIPGGEHAPGEERRILRGPFTKAIPELKRRLETAPVVGYRVKHGLPVESEVLQKLDLARRDRDQQRAPHLRTRAKRDVAPVPKPRIERKATGKEAQLAVRMNQKLEAAERKLNRIRQRKATLERELSQHTEAEGSESERRLALQSEFESQMAASERLSQKLDSHRQRSEQKLDRASRVELEASAKVDALRKAVSDQVDNYRRKNAGTIAKQLREARDATETKPPAEAQRVKRSAEAVAERLRRAHDACARNSALEREAVQLATDISDDMPDGNIDRIDGAILFNDIAERRGIPSDIRIKITRQFFSRQA